MNVKPNLAKCRKAGTKFKLLSTSEGRDGLFKSISDNLHISDDHINALIDWKLSYLKAMHEEQKFLDYDTQFPFQSMPQIKKLSDNVDNIVQKKIINIQTQYKTHISNITTHISSLQTELNN
eukprot:14861_1